MGAADTAAKLRAAGGKVMHTPIVFKADASDNPNKGLGILAGCAKDSLFTEGTWNADFCAEMKPAEGDIRIVGKRGLDAFPNTSLEKELVDNGIETLVICGFLTNCCVESTMRTACEKGFNVVTLTDCCAATSQEGHDAATTGTFGMFSLPMTAADFAAKLPAPPKPTFNAFAPTDAKGGTEIVPAKTALLCIEFQNEFTTEGGKRQGNAHTDCLQGRRERQSEQGPRHSCGLRQGQPFHGGDVECRFLRRDEAGRGRHSHRWQARPRCVPQHFSREGAGRQRH